MSDLLDEFKAAGSTLLNTATDVYKAKLTSDQQKAQLKAQTAQANQLAAQQAAAMQAQSTEPWWKAKWVMPAGLGLVGVLILTLVLGRRRK